jgi:hypothetical protein
MKYVVEADCLSALARLLNHNGGKCAECVMSFLVRLNYMKLCKMALRNNPNCKYEGVFSSDGEEPNLYYVRE